MTMEYLRRGIVKSTVLVSHIAAQRSFEITGDEILSPNAELSGEPQGLNTPIYSPRFFGFSVDDGGTNNNYSYAVEMKMVGAHDRTYTSMISSTVPFNQDSPKTVCPGTTAGASAGFAEGDEWHTFFMLGAKYRVRLLTPAVNAPEAEQVILKFYFGT